MTSKERVKRAINFTGPDRLPLFCFNADFNESDIMHAGVVHHFMGEKYDRSEFGFTWERIDGTMGQPRLAGAYTVPDPNDPRRFDGAMWQMREYGPDKYYMANIGLTGFTLMTILHGFEETLANLYAAPETSARHADEVFEFEEAIIRNCAGRGFDAVFFSDDWGTQNDLFISPAKWREFFKPRYKRQFDLCHALGMDVYFHCCGQIYDIIGDFVEIGVDIMNISQPNVFDIGKLGREFGGKVCFSCPVSYQTTSLTGTRDEIFADVKRLKDNLGCFNGGLIGYVETYKSIGLTDENYGFCKAAFLGRSSGVQGFGSSESCCVFK